ncbi:class I adenylate-forming enzyme family protein [Pseudooceanicola aestuarii]|uniref:class I adenylate-forming enzyme family protein n=1 Tax=Pseudooceanicola aestuarii TaxID=2697319 RepID=UPI0019543351|nr:AMP-binding protein [Pseudooceanicola aestuarii]
MAGWTGDQGEEEGQDTMTGDTRTTTRFDGGVTPPPASIARIALGDILRRSARRTPGNIALVDGDRRVTYAALDAMANRMAHELLARGAQKGERCATMMANSVELVACLFAINRAGLVWVPINLMLEADDVDYTLTHAGVAHVLTEPAFADHPALGAVARRLTLPVTVLEPGMAFCADQPATEPDMPVDRDDIAAIIYTSGTTSRPKGAMHSHQSIYLAVMCDALEWSLTRDDRIPLQLPLFHCGGHVLLLAFLMVGGTCVLQRGFDAGEMLRVIEEEACTVVIGIPMMYAAMLDHPDMAHRSMASLRFGVHTMAPMYESLLRRMVERICPNFLLTSGQTEMYPITTLSRPDMSLKRFGNVWGESSLLCDLAIMGPDGQILPDGEIGELVHRGPNVMAGYYRDQAATDETRSHGWHHTGDVGRITEDGEFEFLDRMKDMIKSGGENVSSMKVEAALLQCDGVEAAAAVGLPHPRWGEAVTAFVVPRAGHTPEAETILARLRDTLGGFQLPKRIEFVQSLPATATGKMRKVELRMAHADLYDRDTA